MIIVMIKITILIKIKKNLLNNKMNFNNNSVLLKKIIKFTYNQIFKMMMIILVINYIKSLQKKLNKFNLLGNNKINKLHIFNKNIKFNLKICKKDHFLCINFDFYLPLKYIMCNFLFLRK